MKFNKIIKHFLFGSMVCEIENDFRIVPFKNGLGEILFAPQIRKDGKWKGIYWNDNPGAPFYMKIGIYFWDGYKGEPIPGQQCSTIVEAENMIKEANKYLAELMLIEKICKKNELKEKRSLCV